MCIGNLLGVLAIYTIKGLGTSSVTPTLKILNFTCIRTQVIKKEIVVEEQESVKSSKLILNNVNVC